MYDEKRFIFNNGVITKLIINSVILISMIILMFLTSYIYPSLSIIFALITLIFILFYFYLLGIKWYISIEQKEDELILSSLVPINRIRIPCSNVTIYNRKDNTISVDEKNYVFKISKRDIEKANQFGITIS